MKFFQTIKNIWLQSRQIISFGFIIFTGNIAHAQGIATKTITLQEIADRIAIKELIDAYAHDADRRDADAQSNLFMPDGIIENYEGEPTATNKPDAILRGRKELRNGFATLKKYDITMHFNGQSDLQLRGDTATGETYCLAHQFWNENNQRILMIIGIRYYDTFVRVNGNWFFAKRKLIFDWIDRKPSKTRNPGE
jgi:hypothetical protein